MMPVVSAGSNQMGAIFTWIAHVIWPLGSPFCATAVLRCGHPWCQASTPAAPLKAPCNTRRRLRDVPTGEELHVIPYLLRVTTGFRGPGQGRCAKCQYYKCL